VGRAQLRVGKSFLDVARRPNLTKEDAQAIERDCPSVAMVDVWLGAMGGFSASRIYYGNERTKRLIVLGATENWSRVNFAKVEAGRVFTRWKTSTAAGGPARLQRVAGALSQPRSDRQDGPHRRDAVHGHRRARQAAEPGNFPPGRTTSR
jgi:hypothetical protein